MRATIVVNGFIGDTLFASSVAEGLKKEHALGFDGAKKYDDVQFVIRHAEPYELLCNNPYIDGVHYAPVGDPVADPEHVVFNLGEVDQSEWVTVQFQRKCGIVMPVIPYTVYTNKSYDILAQNYVARLTAQTQKKVIAVQTNWKERTFGFTKEEYERGIDIPPLGYGGRRRDTDKILQALSTKYTLLPVGLPDGTPLGTMGIFGASTYSMTASLIKNCYWMIGGEGGLTNLAAGVGTKTIITGDFIHQLYGWNGCIKKIKKPKMGPEAYFEGRGHVTLDPFLTDEEVVQSIMETIG